MSENMLGCNKMKTDIHIGSLSCRKAKKLRAGYVRTLIKSPFDWNSSWEYRELGSQEFQGHCTISRRKGPGASYKAAQGVGGQHTGTQDRALCQMVTQHPVGWRNCRPSSHLL